MYDGMRGTRVDKVATWGHFAAMRAVGIKVLKDRLSQYVRLVAEGETILVTDRDRVVAELAPPRAGRAVPVLDAFLAEAVRAGWLKPPAIAAGEPPPRLPVAPASRLWKELEEDRSER